MKIKMAMLAGMVVFMTGMLGCTDTSQSQTGKVFHISREEFAKVAKKENATVIDVRTPGEVAQGYIKGATVFADVYGAEFKNTIEELDKNKAYIVYCRSGSRSASASEYMVSQGFKKVYNLQGGIDRWQGEIVKDK
jgi:phage shock protein E